MKRLAILAAALGLAGCATAPPDADPASDAPERRVAAGPVVEASSYAEALVRWHDAAEVNAWIGARFEYDPARAQRLSETQRQKDGRLPIHEPEAFFAAPRGVCVDLARFAVETLRTIRPESRPGYLMIEFDPLSIGGNVLRRHWVATYERDGALYVFADSKRPGHVAGPYRRLDDYVAEYARYRGRAIVSFRALPSFERQARTIATRRAREDRPAAP